MYCLAPPVIRGNRRWGRRRGVRELAATTRVGRAEPRRNAIRAPRGTSCDCLGRGCGAYAAGCCPLASLSLGLSPPLSPCPSPAPLVAAAGNDTARAVFSLGAHRAGSVPAARAGGSVGVGGDSGDGSRWQDGREVTLWAYLTLGAASAGLGATRAARGTAKRRFGGHVAVAVTCTTTISPLLRAPQVSTARLAKCTARGRCVRLVSPCSAWRAQCARTGRQRTTGATKSARRARLAHARVTATQGLPLPGRTRRAAIVLL